MPSRVGNPRRMWAKAPPPTDCVGGWRLRERTAGSGSSHPSGETV